MALFAPYLTCGFEAILTTEYCSGTSDGIFHWLSDRRCFVQVVVRGAQRKIVFLDVDGVPAPESRAMLNLQSLFELSGQRIPEGRLKPSCPTGAPCGKLRSYLVCKALHGGEVFLRKMYSMLITSDQPTKLFSNN